MTEMVAFYVFYEPWQNSFILDETFFILWGEFSRVRAKIAFFFWRRRKEMKWKKVLFNQHPSVSISQVWFSSNLALNTVFENHQKKSHFKHYNFFQSKTIWIFAQKHLDFGQLDTYSKIFPFWRNRCPMYKKNLLEIRAETAFEMTLKIPDFCLLCTIIHLLGQFSSKVWVKSPKKAFYPKPKL